MKNVIRIIAALLPLTSCYWSTIMAADFETIVLTDKIDHSEMPPEVRESIANNKERQAKLMEREASRKKHLKKLRRIVNDTESKGFAVVQDLGDSGYDNISAMIHQPERQEPIRYGYNKANLDTPAFDGGRLVAVQPLHEDAGLSYQMLYAFEFDDLGTVVIDELNYINIPDARIVVNKPAGNLHINGYPATYTAMKNRDGTKGMTGIIFYTENKLFSVTALRCITRDDKEAFEHLVQVASSLY
ncbi:MAG: hypothetical protein OER97_05505 [Gammaproteobacteria bacterium]|nr:hypothetical protein [Gammaproteobacteria bacterium]